MSKIRVQNMTSNSGAAAANQFIIRECFQDGRLKAVYFQSYDSVIVEKRNGKIYLDRSTWNYSRTTGRYRNIFLGEGIARTREKIASGEYKLKKLNR